MDTLFDKYHEPMVSETRGVVDTRRTAEERALHVGKSAEVLEALVADGGWVSTPRLVEINHRFSASIHQLRQQGYVIDSRKSEAGCYEWRYVERVEVRPTDEGWQARYYRCPHWREVRRQRLEHDGNRCCNCHTTSDLHVHHWRYDLFAERLCDLMTFCQTCHERIHDAVTIGFPRTISVDIYNRLEGC